MKSLLILLALCACVPREQKVYICRSGTSYAYHNKYCQGLRSCTHKIDTVTVQEAIALKHSKPCGYCYR